MKNKFALWSFIFGLLGFLLIGSIFIFRIYSLGDLFGYLSFILGIITTIFGIIGIKKAREKGGLFLAIIGCILGVILFIALLIYYMLWIKARHTLI